MARAVLEHLLAPRAGTRPGSARRPAGRSAAPGLAQRLRRRVLPARHRDSTATPTITTRTAIRTRASSSSTCRSTGASSFASEHRRLAVSNRGPTGTDYETNFGDFQITPSFMSLAETQDVTQVVQRALSAGPTGSPSTTGTGWPPSRPPTSVCGELAAGTGGPRWARLHLPVRPPEPRRGRARRTILRRQCSPSGLLPPTTSRRLAIWSGMRRPTAPDDGDRGPTTTHPRSRRARTPRWGGLGTSARCRRRSRGRRRQARSTTRCWSVDEGVPSRPKAGYHARPRSDGQEVGDEGRPAGPMAGPRPAPVSRVEVLVEENQIAPARVTRNSPRSSARPDLERRGP